MFLEQLALSNQPKNNCNTKHLRKIGLTKSCALKPPFEYRHASVNFSESITSLPFEEANRNPG